MILLGVYEMVKTALKLIKVQNAHDLATLPVFEAARAVQETDSMDLTPAAFLSLAPHMFSVGGPNDWS